MPSRSRSHPCATAAAASPDSPFVARDITARLEVKVSLREARKSTECANRELESFSYSVAHDLRAPLRGIICFAQIIAESQGEKLDDEGRGFLGRIMANSRQMGALIDALLSLSRLSRTELKRELVDVSSLTCAIAGRLERADLRNNDTEIVVQAGMRAECHPVLAATVNENLVGNAWKFTGRREKARIEVGEIDTSGSQVFFVKDNGASFDMTYANKLFAPFQRLHSSEDFPGTGVGLTTVQRIIARHGGRIWAESVVEEGSTFFFTLTSAR